MSSKKNLKKRKLIIKKKKGYGGLHHPHQLHLPPPHKPCIPQSDTVSKFSQEKCSSLGILIREKGVAI